jgi:RNA polymerase sigma-70 factor (ECF subfamily)
MNRAFEDIVEAHKNRIYSYAYHFLGRREEAEDVTQEVFLRLWRHLPKLESGCLAAWLTTVTRNAARDSLRRRARTEGRYGPEDPEGVEAGDDPHAEAEDAEFRDRLRRALVRIDEPYRSALILREVQGMKYREIAEALRLPVNTVKTHVHRGRRILRGALAEAGSHVRA